MFIIGFWKKKIKNSKNNVKNVKSILDKYELHVHVDTNKLECLQFIEHLVVTYSKKNKY